MNDQDQIKSDRRLLERIDRDADGCTEWEQDFLESCLRRTDTGLPLAPEQRRKAEQIEQERIG